MIDQSHFSLLFELSSSFTCSCTPDSAIFVLVNEMCRVMPELDFRVELPSPERDFNVIFEKLSSRCISIIQRLLPSVEPSKPSSI